eukprot:TRINITY_DN17539_c0_g1_i6.p2 TRINITY_DN17539_c0_g1~~TRINITY_DN17539_c0_g1_i6.p2  ORF type:complete len:187 (-),score=26.74 TRINITY_DN17539_c0_g1_i6:535-1095(-)
MFKKFSKDEGISNISKIKSSVARHIRDDICTTYPYLKETGLIDVLIPKKEPILIAKCSGPEQIQVVVVGNEFLFFGDRDGPWLPVLRLLHKYPEMMPRLRADVGAIKFVLGGANIMCPGLTSPGATIHDEVGAKAAVAIYAEDREHAMAVGRTEMSTQDIRKINKGIGVENLHYLNDGLWKMPTTP